MSFVRLTDISLAFADRDLLDQVNYSLEKGDKAALSGANGSGKSTLLKILAGQQEADSGQVTRPKNCRLSYLPQSGILLGRGTVAEEAERAFDFVLPLIAEMEQVAEDMARHPPEPQATRLSERHHEIQEFLLNSGYYQRAETIEATLRGLGFRSEDLKKPAHQFSGGWQMRIALARALLEQPDILLMDEPTNYLDLEAKDWLEKFLVNFEGGVLLVSHDRGFLDAVVREVAEIFNGKLTVYKGNYTAYETRRRQEIATLIEAWKKQQAEFEKAEEYINRFRAKATKAAGVQSKIKQMDKVERIVIPESLVKMHFDFPPAPHSGRMILETASLEKSYGANKVLSQLDLHIERGEKIVVTGRNGAGKSTLMRILAGEDRAYAGTVRLGTDVRIAYFSQDHETKLNPDLSVLEEVEQEAPTHMLPHLRGLLGAFLFRDDDVFKKVAVLSGGEKNRLSLVKMLLEPANLLILDEPTNHLDMASKDVLLEALKAFDGTVLFVSHDKYFIGELAQKVVELSPAGHRLFLGDYAYYQTKLAEEASAGQDAGKAVRTEVQPTTSQLSREDSKKRQAQLKKLQREEEELLQKIDSLGSDHQALQAELAKPEVYTNGARVREIQQKMTENETAQEQATARWEAVSLELEALNR